MVHSTVQLNTAGTASLECFVLDERISSKFTKTRPALIVCPGGAYMKLAQREGEPVAMRFLGLGYHVFVLRYPVLVTGAPKAPGRMPQTDPHSHYPEQVFSLMRAMTYVRAHADAWGIDETRIYALGFSAGGHVVGSLAEHWDDPELLARGSFTAEETKPSGVVLCYPMVSANLVKDIVAASDHAQVPAGIQDAGGRYEATPKQMAELQVEALFGSKIPTEADYEALDLRLHVRPDMPRAFVWQTAADDVLHAHETTEFVGALQRVGVPCEYHLFQTGHHGMSLADRTSNAYPQDVNVPASVWVQLAHTWLSLDGAPFNHAL